jgi:hypothetical protein
MSTMNFALLSTTIISSLRLAYGRSLPVKSARFPILLQTWILTNLVDDYGLPWCGLKTDGVAIGWVPSNGNATESVTSPRYTMQEINQKLGAISSTYGMYSHLDSDSYNGYELLEEYDDIIRSDAVFIPSVMPTLSSGFSGVTPEVATQVAKVMSYFTDKGVVVWLRFAHEMNWYVDPVRRQPIPAHKSLLMNFGGG